MKLLEQTAAYLSDELRAALTQAVGLPAEEVGRFASLATAQLVRQLAQPAGTQEVNAHWDLGHQLYLKQVLTDRAELLRTDIGWPERRRLLAEQLLGAPAVAKLTATSPSPPAALALLGYLTVLVLAVVGEYITQAGCSPVELGSWLREQKVPAAASTPPAPAASRTSAKSARRSGASATTPAKAVAPGPVAGKEAALAAHLAPDPASAKVPAATPAPANVPSVPKVPAATPAPANVPSAHKVPATSPSPTNAPQARVAASSSTVATPAPASPASPRPSVKLLVLGGSILLAGLGSYMLLGQSTPAAAEASEPVGVAPATAPLQAAATSVVSLPAASTPAVSKSSKETLALPAESSSAKEDKPTAPASHVASLADTAGNAALALQLGGSFDAEQGRYSQEASQLLTIKLVQGAKLLVGVNSPESLLYKRLVNPELQRPRDIVLDRLLFAAGQASLAAEGSQQLSNVARLLQTFPQARLLVLGHAHPGEEDPIHLSLKRAEVAVEELQRQGIAAGRVQAQGAWATAAPTADDSPERRALLQGISLKISRL